jgi:hypothetical protein
VHRTGAPIVRDASYEGPPGGGGGSSGRRGRTEKEREQVTSKYFAHLPPSSNCSEIRESQPGSAKTHREGNRNQGCKWQKLLKVKHQIAHQGPGGGEGGGGTEGGR